VAAARSRADCEAGDVEPSGAGWTDEGIRGGLGRSAWIGQGRMGPVVGSATGVGTLLITTRRALELAEVAMEDGCCGPVDGAGALRDWEPPRAVAGESHSDFVDHHV
jgi:hypothetical protein